MSTSPSRKRRIGLALGGGAARGWAHIGVLRALADRGIEPDLVCGTSIGSLVGGAYASGRLDALESWVRGIARRDVARMLDIDIRSGGFIAGDRLFALLEEKIGDFEIDQCAVAFGAVSTDLKNGSEVWHRRGGWLNAVRASAALPGIFAPYFYEGRWLVDGGLVNPVPTSLCHALGADAVIAVNLNENIVGKRFRAPENGEAGSDELVSRQITSYLTGWLDELREKFLGPGNDRPGLFDVLVTSIYIMQDRITRSRLAGNPPDVLIAPRLREIGLMEFERAEPAIAEGRAAVERAASMLESVLG